MPADSEEAELWPTRKPSKGTRGILQRAASIGGEEGVKFATAALSKKVFQKVTRKAARAFDVTVKKGIQKGVGTVAGTAATYGVGATSAAILAAAAGGYLIGVGAMRGATRDEKLDRALQQLTAARREATRQLGRPLTKAENRVLYEKYLDLVARIRAGDPTAALRPGME